MVLHFQQFSQMYDFDVATPRASEVLVVDQLESEAFSIVPLAIEEDHQAAVACGRDDDAPDSHDIVWFPHSSPITCLSASSETLTNRVLPIPL